MSTNTVKTSKFLSFVLRHEPEAIGLALDTEGWAEIDALIACAAKHGTALDRDLIALVVDTNDKKRFSLSPDGQRIRAAQGHSTASVALSYAAIMPPEHLFHGTATRFLDSIKAEGLIAGDRHHVHLSADIETATRVGQRHGKPVVLRIEAGAMHRTAHEFYLSDNGVWLTAHVPPRFFVQV